MSFVSLPTQPSSVPTNIYSASKPVHILYQGAREDQRPGQHSHGAYDHQAGQVWGDFNRCPAHQQAEGSENFQSLRTFYGPFDNTPSNHPYRSSASLVYHPEPNGPNTLGGPTSILDQSSGATFTSAPRHGTGCNDNRPYVNTWTPGLQPKEDIDEVSFQVPPMVFLQALPQQTQSQQPRAGRIHPQTTQSQQIYQQPPTPPATWRKKRCATPTEADILNHSPEDTFSQTSTSSSSSSKTSSPGSVILSPLYEKSSTLNQGILNLEN